MFLLEKVIYLHRLNEKYYTPRFFFAFFLIPIRFLILEELKSKIRISHFFSNDIALDDTSSNANIFIINKSIVMIIKKKNENEMYT